MKRDPYGELITRTQAASLAKRNAELRRKLNVVTWLLAEARWYSEAQAEQEGGWYSDRYLWSGPLPWVMAAD